MKFCVNGLRIKWDDAEKLCYILYLEVSRVDIDKIDCIFSCCLIENQVAIEGTSQVTMGLWLLLKIFSKNIPTDKLYG